MISKVTFFFLMRYELEKGMLISIERINRSTKQKCEVHSIVPSDRVFFNNRLPSFYGGQNDL